MDAQNSRMAVRGRKIAAREAKKLAIQLKNGPSKQDSRPDGENKSGDEKNGGVQLRSRLGKQTEPFAVPAGAPG
jgi:hypothetical protein